LSLTQKLGKRERYAKVSNRYESDKKYSAHAGLVPWAQDSNKTIRHGSYHQARPRGIENGFCTDDDENPAASK